MAKNPPKPAPKSPPAQGAPALAAPRPAAPAPRPSAPAPRPSAPGGGGGRPQSLPKAPPKKTAAPAPVSAPSSRPWDSRLGFKGPQGAGNRPTTAPAPAPAAESTSDSADSGSAFSEAYDPYAVMEANNQMNLIATLSAIFKDYGLESLTPQIINYVREGYNGDAIAVLLRETPEYKSRFPAMSTLAKKGRAITESAYIEYERTAAQLEKQYGLPKGMVGGNITGLLENEISTSELNDRIMMASAASIQAPQELKDTFQKYYNIGTGALTGYWLDPNIAQPLLEKQFQTAIIGAEAVRQGVDVDVYNAQNLQSLGINADQARQGFGEVARDMSLTGGYGETIGQSDLITGAFGNQQAATQTERIRQSRQGRFQGGGGYAAESGGVTGLGTSSV